MPGELEKKLKVLGKKGMVYNRARRDSVRYRLNDSSFFLPSTSTS